MRRHRIGLPRGSRRGPHGSRSGRGGSSDDGVRTGKVTIAIIVVVGKIRSRAAATACGRNAIGLLGEGRRRRKGRPVLVTTTTTVRLRGGLSPCLPQGIGTLQLQSNKVHGGIGFEPVQCRGTTASTIHPATTASTSSSRRRSDRGGGGRIPTNRRRCEAPVEGGRRGRPRTRRGVRRIITKPLFPVTHYLMFFVFLKMYYLAVIFDFESRLIALVAGNCFCGTFFKSRIAESQEI